MSDPYASPLYRKARPIVLAAAAWRCQIRGPRCTQVASTVDHVIPIAYGGTNDLGNLRAACVACNCRGGAHIVAAKRRGQSVGRNSRRW
jgi:5-methylcytosine-specific restriction endonuclease McrA